MHVPGRMAAPCAAKSSPDGCSANTLDNRPAEPAGTAPEPPPVVAKCSVMIGGQLVSSRRLLGRSGLKSDSAGSSWRPQLTQISAAPQTWHLCFKITPAIRQISPSSARSYFGRLYSLSGRDVMRSGTFPAIQGWSHPCVVSRRTIRGRRWR